MENKNKPKVLGFCTIFYAGDYLKESLLSIIDYVDNMLIAFTYNPSHGHSYNWNRPEKETRDYIFNLCKEVCGDKLIWDEADSYHSEGQHRDVKYKYSEGIDIILTIDNDEVLMNPQTVIDYIWFHSEREFGFDNYINFFRSHQWYCTDGFRPIRGINLHNKNTNQDLQCPAKVLHFSFCQNNNIMNLKFNAFGHASEIRPNYLKDIFYAWFPGSNIRWLHSVSLQIWENVQGPYDKNNMPEYLQNHPNFNLKLIP